MITENAAPEGLHLITENAAPEGLDGPAALDKKAVEIGVDVIIRCLGYLCASVSHAPSTGGASSGGLATLTVAILAAGFVLDVKPKGLNDDSWAGMLRRPWGRAAVDDEDAVLAKGG